MANKQVTINEMIYNTLRTKNTKVPKYYDVLTALGYELVNDGEWSVQNYWEIKTKVGDRLCISKGYDDRTHLYFTATCVHCYDIKKVDFVNLILMNEKKKGNRLRDIQHSDYAPDKRTPRIEKYYRLLRKISDTKSLINFYGKEYQKAKDICDKNKADLDRVTNNLIVANDEMLAFKDEIRGIYRNGIDD